MGKRSKGLFNAILENSLSFYLNALKHIISRAWSMNLCILIHISITTWSCWSFIATLNAARINITLSFKTFFRVQEKKKVLIRKINYFRIYPESQNTQLSIVILLIQQDAWNTKGSKSDKIQKA